MVRPICKINDVAPGSVKRVDGGRFDIASGTPTCLPAAEPIATYAVAVVGDDVCIGD